MKIVPLALGLLLLASSPAHAAYGTPQERAACLPDRKRFCPYLTDESTLPLIWFCIETNRSRFSRACSAVLQRRGL